MVDKGLIPISFLYFFKPNLKVSHGLIFTTYLKTHAFRNKAVVQTNDPSKPVNKRRGKSGRGRGGRQPEVVVAPPVPVKRRRSRGVIAGTVHSTRAVVAGGFASRAKAAGLMSPDLPSNGP